MPQFKYRLQPLLDVKSERKQQAQRDLGQRMADLKTEQDALGEMQAERERVEKKLEAAKFVPLGGAAGASVESIRQYTDYLRGLGADVEKARDAEFSQRLRLREFEDRAAAARRHLADCSRELEVLNKHRERLEQRFVRAEEKKDAAEQDEIGSAMFYTREART